jgi:hypothetical protein
MGKTGYDLPIMRMGDFMKTVRSLPPQEYIIESILPKNEVFLEVGDPWQGKSLELQKLACSFGAGGDYHGLKVKKCQCLYITWEGSSEGITKRFDSITLMVDPEIHPYMKLLSENTPLNTEKGYKRFRELLDEANNLGNKVDVVLIDSAPYTMTGNLKTDEVVNEWWEKLQKIIRDFDITPIFSWEFTKPEQITFDSRNSNPFTIKRIKTASTTAYKVNTVVAIGELNKEIKGKWGSVGHRIVVLKSKDSPPFEPLTVDLSPAMTWEGQEWRKDDKTGIWKAVDV